MKIFSVKASHASLAALFVRWSERKAWYEHPAETVVNALREGEQDFFDSLFTVPAKSRGLLGFFLALCVPTDSTLEQGCSPPAPLPGPFPGWVAPQPRQPCCPSLPPPSPSSWRCGQGVGEECSGLKLAGEEQKRANGRQQPFHWNYASCFQGRYFSNGKTAHNAVNLSLSISIWKVLWDKVTS